MAWPENPAFVMFVRDKAPWVAQCVRSVLAQTYSPMTLVFSDQGSSDGTKEAIEKEVRSYNGPNEIVLLSCPETTNKGMPGLIPATEILKANRAVSNLIREGRSSDILNVIQAGRSQGMHTLDESLERLVREQKVEPEEAYLYAHNKARFRNFMGPSGVGSNK